ncbi:DUF6491 family protein [Thalassotalea castellviae]|uniref:DUF6491 family protein n=1 Tax=Thalassotalea castellviae TaxID=3075612 RepID=A0ABU3A1W4_9GAMM|nr:DUF6491 family protein [Thalassotalea sp. W431]MDT0604164.1 DUF6491 family protein [Thalassotalea sp. W431]
MKLITVILTSVLCMTACTSNNNAIQKAKNVAFHEYVITQKIEPVTRVSRFRFQAWSSLTDEFIILSSSHKRKFLIELAGYCPDLRWTQAIILNRLNTATLNARSDSISTVEAPQIQCRIKTIYPLTVEQLADIRAIDNPKKDQTDEEESVNTQEQTSTETNSK